MSQVSSFSSFNATPAAPPSSPSGGGGGGSMFSNPKFILFGVIGLILVVFVWLKSRGSGSADSGYPLGQPNTPSGATTGTPTSNPPANTISGPTIKDFANGVIACDDINGCQYFNHPQAATTVAPTTTTPTPTSPPVTTTSPIVPPVVSTPPPVTPTVPIGPAPVVVPPISLSPLPPTIIHPTPVPITAGVAAPIGSQQLAAQVTSAAQQALNNVFAHPTPPKPPVATTHVPLHVAPAPAPKVAPRPATTPVRAPRPV